MKSTIKRLTDKGFGFINADDAQGKDLFFHSNNLVGVSYQELREGDEVTFEVERSEKGPTAVNVQLAS
jgi:cold shock protein